jgi:hypothetical protein
MKGKPTWKPRGLCAKRWREAAHPQGGLALPLPKRVKAKQLPESSSVREFVTKEKP